MSATLREASDAKKVLASALPSTGDSQELERLRLLLLGSDYIGLLALKNQLQDMNQYTARVASVVSEAIQLRANAQDDSLTKALTPTMGTAIERFITSDPQMVANALYPVMGPAIRKSIHETLNQTLETFNQLLEQSLSPRSIRWRFDAWRTGRKYSEVVLMKTLVYQVEQVFLIHRETSLLLHHVVAETAIAKDPDMVSSMLSAIQDFMADSFTNESSLNALRLGDLSVLIEQGPYVAIAAVVRGAAPAELRSLLVHTLESVHQRYDHLLKHYNGNNEPFTSTHPLLVECLRVQHNDDKPAKKPWLAYAALGALLAGLGYWGYHEYVEQQQRQAKEQLWQQALVQWDALDGIVILSAQPSTNGYVIKGLKDPLVPDVASTITPEVREQFNPSFEWQPYLATEPRIAFERVKGLLNPPAGVELALEGNTLKVSGTALQDWATYLDQHWAYSMGLQQLDTSQLIRINPQAEVIQLVQAIKNISFSFEVDNPAPTEMSAGQVPVLVDYLKRLGQLVKEQQLEAQVTVMGGTDATGTEQYNRQLGLLRAQGLIQQLVNQGVPSELFVAAVAAAPSLSTPLESQREQRTVTFKVILQPLGKSSG